MSDKEVKITVYICAIISIIEDYAVKIFYLKTNRKCKFTKLKFIGIVYNTFYQLYIQQSNCGSINTDYRKNGLSMTTPIGFYNFKLRKKILSLTNLLDRDRR